jgi:hypothetical protein
MMVYYRARILLCLKRKAVFGICLGCSLLPKGFVSAEPKDLSDGGPIILILTGMSKQKEVVPRSADRETDRSIANQRQEEQDERVIQFVFKKSLVHVVSIVPYISMPCL